MDRPFVVVMAVCGAAGLLIYIARLIQVRRRGPLFPPRNQCEVLYHEYMAGGWSLENTWTRYFGARNCLKLTVTADELWMTTVFPFSLTAAAFDLEHRILKRDIISVWQQKRQYNLTRVMVKFQRADGRTAVIALIPTDMNRFVGALNVGRDVGDDARSGGELSRAIIMRRTTAQ